MQNVAVIADRSTIGWIVIICGAIFAGCAASPPPRNPVPEELVDAAFIAGIPRARYPGDVPPPFTEEWLQEGTEEELRARAGGVMDTEHHYLAISGGGANGAYAAGLLVGWSEEGSRPTFTVVTGISTGALAAPFAGFFYPVGLDWELMLERLNVPGQPDLFVIRNARIAPTYTVVERRTPAIGLRSINSLLRTQGLGDLYRIYLAAERDGLEYHGAAIPDDFTVKPATPGRHSRPVCSADSQVDTERCDDPVVCTYRVC